VFGEQKKKKQIPNPHTTHTPNNTVYISWSPSHITFSDDLYEIIFIFLKFNKKVIYLQNIQSSSIKYPEFTDHILLLYNYEFILKKKNNASF